ncbi:D-tagatose-bisphosphate aldolase, class II, non-catalytic subunit [Rhizobium sp. B230/85]|uniref:D-tagatose-bisphosphate aldolase, class II, non-catalytic subunit n=1 Tax=unclassified Rhizobium TaxID=2613769 RepID=UPI001ADC8FEE|nr:MULTISPECIES: D-tagatose-bisphosphate aldolase, class II, non-catalytic subunit [unclassified Rhizobium]MBO9134835.1 D-tagatose-bisphosphate aldolase, class II, non-catalytic subunit [Rhizobium sp. B209b/85]QXZ98229.1 D-tagatose-bisphosphate aldolase, class II, non-catalytic subunit [Rhizobium sp. B230/85]
MNQLLTRLASSRQEGSPFGITSVCSAHPTVLRAALRRARNNGRQVLIEATCNQVNQFGGYTGMTPADFIGFVCGIAADEGLERSRILFGGDHLGPNPWKKETAEAAMSKSETLVRHYVLAGFSKIHLDTSMACAGEPASLGDRIIAERAARLAAVAEQAARANGLAMPVYVLGTEVPTPGGADHALDTVAPTSALDARSTIEIHREVFERAGLADAFSRVIAFVVQPGVEFGNANVIAYRPEAAFDLGAVLDAVPQFVFEAHSTDYQTVEALSALVRDGYPILKVGPGLTFAYRESLYGLDLIASELVPGYGDRSLMQAMEDTMLADPTNWLGHYHGKGNALRVERHYSYSDRIRYYWGKPQATEAVENLLLALRGVVIPETVARQFLPSLVIPSGRPIDAELVLIQSVDAVLETYDAACLEQPTSARCGGDIA